MERYRGISWQEIRIGAIVFDVDGTLTDSIEAYYEVFRDATARFGIHVKKEDVLEPMATGTLIWDRAIPMDMEDRDNKIKQIGEVISEIFPKRFEQVQPFPGVEPVLKELKERSLKLGVLTSSWASALRPLKSHSLDGYFDVLLSREDGFRPKPSPEGMLRCFKRMGVNPESSLVIGDSPVDIRSGKAAGALTIGVLSGIGSREQLEAEAPTFIIETVGDLPAKLDLECLF
jgi:HAD superfamily hydrolase (TIGR01509 family)